MPINRFRFRYRIKCNARISTSFWQGPPYLNPSWPSRFWRKRAHSIFQRFIRSLSIRYRHYAFPVRMCSLGVKNGIIPIYPVVQIVPQKLSRRNWLEISLFFLEHLLKWRSPQVIEYLDIVSVWLYGRLSQFHWEESISRCR